MAGTSALSYQVVEGWEQLPKGYAHRDVAGVAVDSEDRVYLICRGDHPIIAYDRNGKFLGSWGEGQFTYRTHGITVGPDENLYCTDDGNHTVRKFTPKGKLLMTLGTMDKPADTGYDGKDYMTITKPADGFNRPTNLAVGPQGDLYVSDGYGNCRVHQFGPNGERKRSWGVPGTGPGQFYLPHGIAAAADGRLFVCDRENDRIQIFSRTASISPSGPRPSGPPTWCSTPRVARTFPSCGGTRVTRLRARVAPSATRCTGASACSTRTGVCSPDGARPRPRPPGASRPRTASRWIRAATSTSPRSRGPSRRAAVGCPRAATPSRSSR